MFRKILIFLLAVLILIQFFRPAKNVNAGPQPRSIANLYPIPADVDTILVHACYDCHSNNSRYPWYFNVQPSAWFVANHIKDGKRHLNFDEFMGYDKKKQDHKFEDLGEMVDHEDMPLSSYRWMHKDARLTQEQKNKIMAWAKDVRARIAAPK